MNAGEARERVSSNHKSHMQTREVHSPLRDRHEMHRRTDGQMGRSDGTDTAHRGRGWLTAGLGVVRP